MITLHYQRLRSWSFAYAALPFWIFAVSWLKPLWAILLSFVTLITVVVAVGGFFGKKKKVQSKGTPSLTPSEDGITVSRWAIAAVVFIGALWVWWSGIGGWFYQSSDFNYRNAIFRDLITYDWPVIYGGEKGAMVYYIGFWLPAATVGKLASLFTADETAVWTVANTALYLWTWLGVTLTLFLVAFNVRVNSAKKLLFAVLVFIFFSGMDIIGFWAANYKLSKLHLEWWTHSRFQYSSVTTCLFWVFNQTVISWVTTLTMLREKTPRYFVFLGMMCLFNGPLPFVGFLVLAAARGGQFVWEHRKDFRLHWRELISWQNLSSALVLFPVILSYFACNRAVEANGVVQVTGSKFTLDSRTMWYYFFFIMLEMFWYILPTLRDNRKKPLYWAMTGFLLICPFIHVGSAADFCMRASIPALICLCLFVIRYLIENLGKPRDSLTRALCGVLCVVLIVGSMTPVVELARGVIKTAKAGRLDLTCDTHYTLNNPSLTLKKVSNFVCSDYEDTAFFIYFAKK